MTAARGHRELDRADGVERSSVRHRAARSVTSIAARTGSCPSRTWLPTSACRENRLRLPAAMGPSGYRIGLYLRFRERHVEEWLQTREV